jgi:hypothetical protein
VLIFKDVINKDERLTQLGVSKACRLGGGRRAKTKVVWVEVEGETNVQDLCGVEHPVVNGGINKVSTLDCLLELTAEPFNGKGPCCPHGTGSFNHVSNMKECVDGNWAG